MQRKLRRFFSAGGRNETNAAAEIKKNVFIIFLSDDYVPTSIVQLNKLAKLVY